jgi:hypothetical protein
MGREENKETLMMKCLQHQDCEECRLNIEIIGINGNLISKQILQGMEKSGEQVAVHVNRKGELLSVLTVKTTDVPDALSLDHDLGARYTEYLKELKAGESLIIMTTEGSNHVGIYKLPPPPLH